MNQVKFETAKDAGFRMPAEWAPHARCWMAWPSRPELWGDILPATERGYATVANAIAQFEPVTMLVPHVALDVASDLCADGVDIFPADLDDSWTRDSGPNFVKRDDELAASIFHFNAWGGKYERYRKDAALGHRIAEHLCIPTFSSPLFLEGGAINVDGEGTLLTTESCVLNANRNPGISKQDAEYELCHALGVDKVIWLPGDPDDKETDGHVDGTACFVCPGVVMVEICPDTSSKRYEAIYENVRILEAATDANGRRLELIIIEEALAAKARSAIFAKSYVNFYIANGGIVIPGYGIDADAKAYEVVAKAFPDRDVVQIDINDIAIGGGGIHCITQQQPV